MRRLKQILISVVLILWYFIMPQKGYTDYDILSHLYGIMSHANIFHLACNVFCLCSLKNKIRIIPSVVIAFLTSFIPTWYENTMGFSGVIFAILGIEWGEVGQFRKMCKLILPWVLVTLLMPNMNALYHFYSLMGGYLFAFVKGKIYESRR